MKKILIVLLVLPLLMSLSLKTTEKLVGEWEGKENNTAFSLIFDEEGYMYYRQNDEIKGGKEFVSKGKTVTLAYKLDKTTDPYQLDFIFTDHDTAKTKMAYGIVKFINEDVIEISIGSLDQRPSDFTEGDALIFNRKK